MIQRYFRKLFCIVISLSILALGLFPCSPIPHFAAFKDAGIPDRTIKQFLKGDLGIIRPGLPLSELIIAYRFLSGLNLTDKQVQEYLAIDYLPERNAAGVWLRMRDRTEKAQAKWLTQLERLHPTKPELETWTNWQRWEIASVEMDDFSHYPKYNVHAIEKATDHLQELIDKYGSGDNDTDLREWVNGQAAVFSSMPDKPTNLAAVAKPMWLKKDRYYQQAANLFYACKYTEAAAAFSAIAADRQSPWRAWADYLQARCWHRQATLGERNHGIDWSRQLLRQAQTHLSSVLAKPMPDEVKQACLDYLDLLQHKFDLEAMLWRTTNDLLQPTIPRNLYIAIERFKDVQIRFFRTLRADQPPANWSGEPIEAGHSSYFDLGRDDVISDRLRLWHPEKILLWPNIQTAEGDFYCWLTLMNQYQPRPAFQKAWAGWQKHKNAAWLIAVLAYLPLDHEGIEELITAMGSFKDIPAARATLDWYKMRRKMDAAKPDQKRQLLEDELKKKIWPNWFCNDLITQRRALAKSAEDWFRYTALEITADSFEEGILAYDAYDTTLGSLPGEKLTYHWDSEDTCPHSFDQEAMATINALPLDILISIIQKNVLPRQLSRSLAHVAWTRAVILQRSDVQKKLEPFLDRSVLNIIHQHVANSSGAKRRLALVEAIMDLPALSICIEDGWDCYHNDYFGHPFSVENGWSTQPADEGNAKLLFFLTDKQMTTARQEWRKLESTGSTINYYGQTVISYARNHRDDPQVPQSLYKFIDVTRRNSGSYTELSRRAFQILHQNYPDHPLTNKCKYYY